MATLSCGASCSPNCAVFRIGDKYKQEAERIADAVRSKESTLVVRYPTFLATGERGVHRMCTECEEDAGLVAPGGPANPRSG